MFSNDSRWDRHTPDQSREEDVIEVGVIFRKNKIIPTCFVWRHEKYVIEEITYYWQERRGGYILHFFSVTHHSNVYQIYLHNIHMCWRLKDVCPNS